MRANKKPAHNGQVYPSKELRIMNEYEDIIHLEHHTSSRHPRMSLYARAAQFASFAALSGHDNAINDTAIKHQQDVLETEKGEDINLLG